MATGFGMPHSQSTSALPGFQVKLRTINEYNTVCTLSKYGQTSTVANDGCHFNL